MNYLNVLEAREAHRQGKNITKFLRDKFNESENTSEIIEIAYDIQAGSYIARATAEFEKVEAHVNEMSDLLEKQLISGDSLLDVGAGEITTLSLLLNNIDIQFTKVLAFDISWSRLFKGREFHRNHNKSTVALEIFVADMKEIPLHRKCVDVVTSSHALEPNGKNLSLLLKELFRITKRKLVLFDPSYELNSKEGKTRMDKLGYIKNIESEVVKLGGKLIDVIPMSNIGNPLNPTACYVIEPPEDPSVSYDAPVYCVPGTDFKMKNDGLFLSSKDTGLIFPILDGIPILRSNSAVLATARV